MAVFDLGSSPLAGDDGTAEAAISLGGGVEHYVDGKIADAREVPTDPAGGSASSGVWQCPVPASERPRPPHVKRWLDVALATIGVVVATPVLLVIAAVIKASDRSAPVIFAQTRLGLYGRPFRMYKFRTMDVDAERRIVPLLQHNQASGPLFKLEDDPRVTLVGRWLRRYSLDELPQLFNVLAGSMSLVGPRPPLPDEVRQYRPHEHGRLLVPPGLTGLWQVSGRSLLSWEDSIRLDLNYVWHWSLRLDLKILARTVVAVLNKKGAY